MTSSDTPKTATSLAGMAVGDVLDLDGRYVLATADDDFLQSPGDEEEPVVVDVAEVAGAQKPVIGEGAVGELGHPPVPRCDGHAAELDFALRADGQWVSATVDD